MKVDRDIENIVPLAPYFYFYLFVNRVCPTETLTATNIGFLLFISGFYWHCKCNNVVLMKLDQDTDCLTFSQ